MNSRTGIKMLSRETVEEKSERLESELELEKRGRCNDMKFHESEYTTLAKAYLELCDDGYCKGDISVGDHPCQFYDDETGRCSLKRCCGLD